MNLFQLGDFISHSGDTLNWKVECDSLSTEDWKCLAFIAAQKLPPFQSVIGIPKGGLEFARQLAEYAKPNHSLTPNYSLTIYVDDVYTTASSFLKAVGNRRIDVVGCVAFARNPTPRWIVPIWRLF